MTKSAEAFRTISEVSELLDTPTHVLRFWESKFTQIKPLKRAGGRRYYRPADVALIAGIKELLQGQSLSIKEAQAALKAQGVRAITALGAAALEPARTRTGEKPEVAAAPEATPASTAPEIMPQPPAGPERQEPVADKPVEETTAEAGPAPEPEPEPEPALETALETAAEATREAEPEPDREAEERALEAAQAAVEMARREAEAVRRELARLRAEAERARAAAAAQLAARAAPPPPVAETDTEAPGAAVDAGETAREDEATQNVGQSPVDVFSETVPEMTFSHRATPAPLQDRISAMVAEAVADVIAEALLPDDAGAKPPQDDAPGTEPLAPPDEADLPATAATDLAAPANAEAAETPPQALRTMPEDEAYSFIVPRAPKSPSARRQPDTTPPATPAQTVQEQWHQPSLFDYLPPELPAHTPAAEDALIEAETLGEIVLEAAPPETLDAQVPAPEAAAEAPPEAAADLPASDAPAPPLPPPTPEVDPLERVVSLILSGTAPLQTELTPAGQIDPTANPLGALRAGLAQFAPPALSPIERMRLLAAHDRLQALHARLGQPPRAPRARR